MPRQPRLQPIKKTFVANRPNDWRYRDFRRFGGIPDDPTAAVANDAAMQLVAQTFPGNLDTIYFGAGTWYFSNSIKSTANGTSWFYGRVLMGESKTLTTLRLIDGATGFGSATTPKSFVVTGGVGQPDGSGNQAFSNYILDLTIDTGNNPGASALDYFSNNRGAVRNVSVRCTGGNGYSGVEEARVGNGPCLYKNVDVIGFQYGFRVLNDQYSQTYYNCSVSGQSVAGMLINQATVCAENFNSVNTVPAILITGVRTNLCLITSDGTSTLSGGDGTSSAIVNTIGGSLYLRNIVTSGYATNQTVSLPVGFIPSATVTEYFTQVSHNFQSPATSLNLSIQQTPTTFTSTNLNDWVNVQTYGAIAQNIFTESFDSLPGLNAACATGKPIIYLPKSQSGFSISGTWTIPATVKRIAANFSSLGLIGTAWNATNGQVPVIQTTGTTTDPLFIDFLTVASTGTGFSTSAYSDAIDSYVNQIGIYHNSTRPLVIRSSRFTGGLGIKVAPGAGNVFIEEVLCSGIRIGAGANVWIRELNIEYTRMVVNDGGTLWVTGLKTEGAWVNIETKNGGSTELLGAYCYPIESFKDTVTLTGGSANITVTRNVNQPVIFSTTGSLPAEFTAGATYYVKTASSGIITLTATRGGSTAIVPSSSGTGVHTMYYANFVDYQNQPAIITTDSSFSGVLTVDGTAVQVFPNIFSSTRSGVTRYIKGQQLLTHGNGANCTLFTDYTPTNTTTEQAVIDLQAVATSLGSALSTIDATALDTYIKGLRTDGILAKIPYIFPVIGDSVMSAQYMIDNSRALTDPNAPPVVAPLIPVGITSANYDRRTGIKSNASGQYLDARIDVASNLSTTDIGLHYWTTQTDSAGTHAIMGNVNSGLTSYTAIGHPYFGSETGSIGGALETAANCPTGYVGNTGGFMSVVNNGSRATQFYLNGVATGSVAATPPSGTISNGWRLFDVVKAGSTSTAQKPSSRNILIGLITKGLSATEMLLLTNRTRNLLQQIQRLPYTRAVVTPQAETKMLGGTFVATVSAYANFITSDLRNQAVATGAAMTTSDLTAFDTYISALISNSLMARVSAFYPWSGENLATALKYVNNTSGTPTLTTITGANYDTTNLTWTKSGGVKGGYVNLINPSPYLSQSSAGLHAWVTQAEPNTGTRYILGGVNAGLTNYTALGTTGISNRMAGVIGGGGLGSGDSATYTPDSAGLWSNIANSSKLSQLYLNGSAVGTMGTAATGLATLNSGTSGVEVGIYALGLYKRGTAGVQSASGRGQIFTMLTDYLTSTQMTTLYTITQTYLQSLGRV